MTAPSEWFAAVPGSIGDPIEIDATRYTAEAACRRARELSASTGRPWRVVRITEVAYVAAGKDIK